MHLIFVDDSKQARPTRPGVGSLVAAGAVMLDADSARSAEKALDSLCRDVGFPAGDEFKWSPQRGTWMHGSLHGDNRQRFFLEVARVLSDHNVLAHVVMEDSNRSRATGPLVSAEDDVVIMLLERVASRLKDLRTTALLVADRPGGNRADEDRFVADCLDALNVGTEYVQHAEISFVLSADSRSIRLLQAADLVTSCITAYVAGESNNAPRVAQALLPLFPLSYGRRGGPSIKIHPDYTFGNLYHWLFGDDDFIRRQTGIPLPHRSYGYYSGPDVP
jgi:hypothetical protein